MAEEGTSWECRPWTQAAWPWSLTLQPDSGVTLCHLNQASPTLGGATTVISIL